ncbi:hypothetical protein SBF1_2690008 [Candidatus Desulfosporosinus infrequens]|uniref:Uncharacterized protein n=1 Tax=Candidatus Desulfosporosinus infrequens TaxID=2043169 RepID=A0A2U3KTQ1_9FIRM|nr:hypothetical protein SBF1_2690008 [Candidatus Desulfosporosinus infrequens]
MSLLEKQRTLKRCPKIGFTTTLVRTIWMAETANQDSRMARTLELEAILEAQDGNILEFSEDLYTSIIEKIVVKECTTLEFHLKYGLRFEEHYTLKRSRDLI